MGASHVTRIVLNGAVVSGWTGYHVESSMITPADQFELRRPFDPDAWRLYRRDSDVSIEIDGTTILRGFVDKRERDAREGTIVLSGRDRAGRLVDESAQAINYNGLTILQAFQKLADPWFGTITPSDLRNRTLRRGKGKRVASAAEPSVLINIRVPRRGAVHPGEKRSQVMHEIAARAGVLWWSSADGKEIVVGKPNYDQPAQYLFRHSAPGSAAPGTVKNLVISEDDGDRYSLILCAGTGSQGDPVNYGNNITDHRGAVFDNPFNRVDGTGRDFIHPKRMFMPERDYESYGDAQRVAANEQARRDFKRHQVRIEAPLHGQFLSDGGPATLFSPNTIARIIDEETQLDDEYLIVSCAFSSNRDQGETTTMLCVPTGTQIIL